MEIEKLLDSRPQLGLQILETETDPTISAEDFELLQLQMDRLRQEIESGHQCTISEMRQIILFFRYRRGKLFRLAAAKKAGKSTEKISKTPVRRKTGAAKLKDMDVASLLETLGL